MKNLKKIEKNQKHNIKIVINCAADLGEVGYLNKINIKKWKNSFNLNLFSQVYLFKILSENLIKNKGIAIFFQEEDLQTLFLNFHHIRLQNCNSKIS